MREVKTSWASERLSVKARQKLNLALDAAARLGSSTCQNCIMFISSKFTSWTTQKRPSKKIMCLSCLDSGAAMTWARINSTGYPRYNALPYDCPGFSLLFLQCWRKTDSPKCKARHTFLCFPAYWAGFWADVWLAGERWQGQIPVACYGVKVEFSVLDMFSWSAVNMSL